MCLSLQLEEDLMEAQRERDKALELSRTLEEELQTLRRYYPKTSHLRSNQTEAGPWPHHIVGSLSYARMNIRLRLCIWNL